MAKSRRTDGPAASSDRNCEIADLAVHVAGAGAAQACDQLGGRVGIRRQADFHLRLLDRGAGAGADLAVDFADALKALSVPKTPSI
jgi:hypothetical protein